MDSFPIKKKKYWIKTYCIVKLCLLHFTFPGLSVMILENNICLKNNRGVMMKVFSVIGNKQETPLIIEKIIHELRRRNYSVGLIKDNCLPAYKDNTRGIWTKDKAQVVATIEEKQTAIHYEQKLPLCELLRICKEDFVILEDIKDCNVPRIIVAANQEEINAFGDERTFAISGKHLPIFIGVYRPSAFRHR